MVRDKIPEIIKNSGKIAKYKVLSQTGYIEMLDKKLNEKVAEHHTNKNVEELADILEVIYAIAKTKGSYPKQLYSIREVKDERQRKFGDKL